MYINVTLAKCVRHVTWYYYVVVIISAPRQPAFLPSVSGLHLHQHPISVSEMDASY